MELAYLGGMVVVEFDSYRALRKVSKNFWKDEELVLPL